jgi:hypothetical protein
MRSFGIISFDIENLPVQQKLLMALNKDYPKLDFIHS